jgi:type II secretory pathway pseudopilin PulG
MIVVVIIGILAALAIPRFIPMGTRAKQSEAKQILKQIYTMENTYRQSNNQYWGTGVSTDAANPNTLATIGVEIMPSARYSYLIVTADATNMLVRATATNLDDDAAIDVWEMDERGNLVCINDDSVL